MPKVLQIILSSLWIFSFYDTDINENRAHVHAGHRGTRKLVKIWLEPEVELVDKGELNSSEANEALKIAKQYREEILQQWNVFKQGKPITMIKSNIMIEGYWNIVPEVKNVSFPYKGKRMRVDFKDGRVVIMPISAFPSVQAVPESERGDWYIYGNGFTWDSCPDVIHVEQILGDYQKYGHEMA